MARLPFALYWVWSSLYPLGLTPFETMPIHKSELIAEFTNADKISFLEAETRSHGDIWQSLKDLGALPD